MNCLNHKIFNSAILFFLILTAVVAGKNNNDLVAEGKEGKIPLVAKPDNQMITRFNLKIKSDKIKFPKNNNRYLEGFGTSNKMFFEQVMLPSILPYLDTLKRMQPADAINELALFGHAAYSAYFGRSFYRWGGDILDIDDPQESGKRVQFKYGLDCSGFVALPYELAVFLYILDPNKTDVSFSSKGFELVARSKYLRDTGGRNGSPNNYRIDTSDLINLGREIFTVHKNGKPTNAQMNMLQPGDIVGKNGHFGIIVRIEEKMYYMESGGWVSPISKGQPYRADKALEIFAKRGDLTVRRCLPDLKK